MINDYHNGLAYILYYILHTNQINNNISVLIYT